MKKRYSHFIKPIQIVIDLFIINIITYFVYDKEYLNIFFLSYISGFWLITSYFFGFYEVYRYTITLQLLKLLVKQFLFFIFAYFAYFGIFREGAIVNNQFLILILTIIGISFVKLSWLFLLKKYRSFGNNFRTTIVIGFDDSSKNIIKLFKNKSNFIIRNYSFI